MNAAAEEGARSILDIAHVGSSTPCGVAVPVPEAQLREWFGTERPNRAMLEQADDLFDSMDRGQCVYVAVYEGETPKELFFAGYSYD